MGLLVEKRGRFWTVLRAAEVRRQRAAAAAGIMRCATNHSEGRIEGGRGRGFWVFLGISPNANALGSNALFKSQYGLLQYPATSALDFTDSFPLLPLLLRYWYIESILNGLS